VSVALRGLAHWICAAHRRSVRVVGLPAIALARRLGMLSALPGPPWLLPDPVLSVHVHREVLTTLLSVHFQRPAPGMLRLLRSLLATVGGRARIPPALVPA
jgi:hypothetical protein